MTKKVLRYADFALLVNVDSFVACFEVEENLEPHLLVVFERFMSMNVANFIATGGAFVLNDEQMAEIEHQRTLFAAESKANGSKSVLSIAYEANLVDHCIEMNVLIPGGQSGSTLILREIEGSPFFRMVAVILDGNRFALGELDVTFETTSLSEARKELSNVMTMLKTAFPEISESGIIMSAIIDTEVMVDRGAEVMSDIQKRFVQAAAQTSSSVTSKKPTLH
jgi:hypothetical protein